LSGIEVQRIKAGSVADVAYERIRTLIVDGTVAPSSRLRQGELADALGISRTSVREALHRLAAEELVEFQRNRGFFVAAPLPLDAVLDRLELRLFVEPGIARLAAERRDDDDVRQLEDVVQREARARSPQAAHDLSRQFHMLLARATRNSELVHSMDSLWNVDVGRQLLGRRVTSPTWKEEDVAEHEAIVAAVAAGDAKRAEEHMRQHISAAQSHWSKQATAGLDLQAAPADALA
jgi:DNA-binding GntR family transcriptional regulator